MKTPVEKPPSDHEAFAASANYAQVAEGKEDAALLTWKATLDNQSQSLLSSWGGHSPCNWDGIGCNKAGRITHIDLKGYGLKGKLDRDLNFSYLPYLSSIDLYNNSLYGTIPSNIGILSNLNYLDLSINRLSGMIPFEIGLLTNLRVLYIVNNLISGSIPREIGMLRSLNKLSISNNNLTESIAQEVGMLRSVTNLSLYGNQLMGSIPTSIGN
ncbi:unnamed protein product [Ilex paraguariensis]|uniref:Leucine-rich repeat-containing N-terminal plant-type domain-containing protein n=1 Tax=Ilex paraguariensis TaxID=185542 RepID=A0ABC8QPQ8_9AQUA